MQRGRRFARIRLDVLLGFLSFYDKLIAEE
jgi:hypothetical protein